MPTWSDKEYSDFYNKVNPERRKELPEPIQPTTTVRKPLVRAEARTTSETASRAASSATRAGGALLSGLGTVARKFKGVQTHEEIVAKSKQGHLYFSSNPAFAPVRGANYGMGLYFGNKVSKNARQVMVALDQGYPVDHLELVTGLEVPEIKRALNELASKKMIKPEDLQ